MREKKTLIERKVSEVNRERDSIKYSKYKQFSKRKLVRYEILREKKAKQSKRGRSEKSREKVKVKERQN